MSEHNWSEFNKRISINTNKETIFDFLSTQDNIEKWFLSQADFYQKNGEKRSRDEKVEPGDTYKWMWHGSDDVAEGKIFEVQHSDQIKFSFLDCKVRIEIGEDDGETMV